jgi:hypothetical protein
MSCPSMSLNSRRLDSVKRRFDEIGVCLAFAALWRGKHGRPTIRLIGCPALRKRLREPVR